MKMNDDLFDFIVQTLMEYAIDAKVEADREKSDFKIGRVQAYYEVMDTIKNRLIIYDYDLSKCGLDVDLENLLS